MVLHTYMSSTQEADAGGSQIQGQLELHSETLPQNKLKHALPITIQQPCSLVFI
jgi:hypothetical protein